MPEINLLPDELREKEQKELESVRKKPKVFKIEMSSPQKEKVKQPLKASRPSFFSRLFSRKVKAASPLSSPAKPERLKTESKAGRKSEKVLHIPKVQSAKDQTSPDFLADNISVSKKESEKRESKFEDRVVMPHGRGLSVKGRKRKEKFFSKPPRLTRLKIRSNGQKKRFSFWQKFITKKSVTEKEAKKERLDERGKRLDVNLIPEDLAKKPELDFSKRLFTSGVIIFVFILLIAGGYLGISYYQFKITRQIKGLEVEIVALNQQISKHEETRLAALELQERLGVIHQLLEDHVYWTEFFDLLEGYTINEVYYTNFSMAGRDKLSISAIGKDYNSVAKQLVAFQDATDFVKSVRIDAASAEVSQEDGSYSGVSFNINLEFLPDVFLKPIE